MKKKKPIVPLPSTNLPIDEAKQKRIDDKNANRLALEKEKRVKRIALEREKKKALVPILFEKLKKATFKELKKNKLEYTDKQLNKFVRTIVLPIFRGLNPRDVKVKDIREFVSEQLTNVTKSTYYNPLFIPLGEITGIMWADIDDFLSIDLRAIVDNNALRVDINAGVSGTTGVFNLQDYQYEATQVNEIYEGIRELVTNNSDAEWNGKVVVRKGKKDDGNADSYILQFTLYVDGVEIPPTTTLDESSGIPSPKETQAQRRDRLKAIIARKKELAAQRRKKQKETSMRKRERPKQKEVPATEDKSESLKRQENVKEVLETQKQLIADAERYYKDKIYDKKEFKERLLQIDALITLALSKFKRGGEIK